MKMSTQENLSENPRRRTSPSELLISLNNRYPDETRDEIIARFVDTVMFNEPCIIVVAREWAHLNFNRLTRTEPAPEEKAKAADLRNKTKEAIKESIKQQIVLMQAVLPICGKRLEQATFAECSKEGGWLSKIGKMGKPSEIVGAKLTEQDLKAALSR